MVGTKPGCPFAPRCPLRVEICSQIEPELRAVSIRGADDGADHMAACHRADEVMVMPIGSMFSDSSADYEEPLTT